jgi:hypothetical protein
MRFLCLKTNTVITHSQLMKARYPQMVFESNPEKWSDKALQWAKVRKIIVTPRPEDHRTVVYCGTGYEERDGQLYQTWVRI